MNEYDVIKKLIEKKITISTAESITGGLIAKLITDVAGSSTILKESFVTYSNESKVEVLGVDKLLIENYGVVSREVAHDMVLKLYEKTCDDICVSTTGNAGPSVCDDKPVGRVYIGIRYMGLVNVFECDFKGDREMVRIATAKKIFSEIENICKLSA